MTKTTDTVEVPKKPMTRDERRSLERIVKSDFETLRAELNSQVGEAVERERQRINAEFAEQETELTEISREMRETVEQARQLIENKMTELRERGFSAVPPSLLQITFPAGWQVKGKQEALRDANVRISSAHQKALADLVRQENDAIRQVVLTSVVSDEAQALLNSFPTASEVMSTALASVDQRRAALEGAPQ